MEKRKVLHEEKVISRGRQFYFDVKETEKGRNYLVINQVKTGGENDPAERSRLILFEEDLAQFNHAMMKSILHFNATSEEEREEKIAEARKTHPRAFQKWTAEEDRDLQSMASEGRSMKSMVEFFQRNEAGVKARLKKFGLLQEAEA